MTDHTKLSETEDARALGRVNQAIEALGTDAGRGAKDGPSCLCVDCAETTAALSGVPLVAIGPPGYEHDVKGVPSLSPTLDAIERAGKPCSCDPYAPASSSGYRKDGWIVCGQCGGKIGAASLEQQRVNHIIAEARKVCRDYAEVDAASHIDNDTKWAIFGGVAGLQGAIAALDMKKG